MELSYRTALKFNVPLFVGEFGVGSAAPNCSKWCRDVLYFLDKYSIGRAWWCYHRDDIHYGLLYSDGREKSHIIKYVDRCYIRSSAHPFTSYFNPDNSTFKAIVNVTDARDLVLELRISRRHFERPIVTVNNTAFEIEKAEDSDIVKIQIVHQQLDGNAVLVSVYEKSILEKHKLKIEIMSPANNSFLNHSNITFRWKTAGSPNRCIVKLDGVTIYVGDYIGYISLNLSEGRHRLIVCAFNNFNHIASSLVTLTVDYSPPCILSVAITQTTKGFLLKITAADNVSHIERVFLIVGEKRIPMQKPSQNTFQVVVPLDYIYSSEEAYIIAIDSAENRAKVRVLLPHTSNPIVIPLIITVVCILSSVLFSIKKLKKLNKRVKI